jgi:hypothetical protein
MKKLFLLFPIVVLFLAVSKLDAQTTTITTSYSFTSNANNGILFNVQNTNSYPIIITDISSYFNIGGSNSIEVDYNPTPINSSGSTWTQGTIGAGYSGWVSGYTATISPTAGTVSSLSNNTMSITIPGNATYGICIAGNVTSGIGYSSAVASGITAFTANGVSIVTGDNIAWSVAALPSGGSSYPRGLVGSISYIAGAPPYPPLAGFSYDIFADTVWQNSPYIFVNTCNHGINYYWDVTSYSTTYGGTYTAYNPPATNPRLCAARWNTCYLDTTHQNFSWKFTRPGYYKVKLKVTNIIMTGGLFQTGVDSITKIIVCAPPNKKPVASFFSVNRSVGFTDQLNYYDLSSNGPTAWKWYLNPYYYGINTFAGYPIANSWYSPAGVAADTTTQNPYLYAFDGGVFDVCLAAGNSLGWDTICRHNYLTVNNGFMMCNGSDSVSTLSSGYVYDQGGPTGNYTGATTGTCPAGFRIAACADSVILDIERFQLVAGDSLTIRVGSPTGTIIKTIGGRNLPDSLKHFSIPGGFVFLQMNAAIASPGDLGFAIHWTIVPATYSKPKAAFTMTTNGPTTNGIQSVYKGYVSKYTNTSSGINMSYSWDTNGDGIYGTSIGGDSISANPSCLFNNLGLYTVCLRVTNCVGTDSACKQVRVLSIPSRPTADMTVNRTTGFTTDTFNFYDNSLNGAMTWTWTFNPTTITYLNNTNANSQNPVVFLNSAQCYTVTLRTCNALGCDTKVIPCMVNVVGYNSPGTAYAIPNGSDVGISRVVLGSIDTTTDLQNPVYTQMNDLQKATLFKGVNYTLTTYRLNNNDPMSTKVWIDYNMNANFTDTGETIINEKSKFKISTSKIFRIPDNTRAGNTRMRVGITFDSTELTPDRANLGCFEDYGINIGIDYVKPVLSLIGPSVYKMQIGKHYTELGVTATDNLEGNISSRYVRTGYLDTNTLGYYNLVYTVADLYGNISSPITRVVQVEINQTGPTISLIGKDTMNVGVNYNYSELGATAKDNLGKDITNLISISGNVNKSVIGTYPVTYSITDAFGFTARKIRTVIVMDTTSPVIMSINGKTLTDTVRSQIGSAFNAQNAVMATDNYWSNLQLTQTGAINVNLKGYYTLLFNTTDGSGNQAVPFRLVVKVDNIIPPVVSLIGESDITVDVNTTFYEPGINFSSVYYSYGSLVLSTTSNLDMTKLGTYTNTYCVSDPSNNVVCLSRIIHVVDQIAPVITLIGDDPFILSRYHAYSDQGVMITDNYYTEAQLKPLLVAHYSRVRNDVPGVYYIPFDITDPSGNIANTVIRTVNVIDMFEGVNTVNSNNKISIYPNPNNGKFTVDYESGVQSIKVYSSIGALVKESIVNRNSKSAEIDMTGMNEGIYIVKVEGNGNSFTQKITLIK